MGGKMLCRVFACFRIAALKGNVLGVAPLAKQVYGSVRGDARNPSVQIVLKFILITAKLVDAPEGLHQGFLLRVFRISRISRQPQCATIKMRRIGEDQGCECLAIAETRLGQKRGRLRRLQTQCCAAHVARKGGMPSTTWYSSATY